MIMRFIEDKKYIMTEADGVTKKEVIYKGGHHNGVEKMHKLYVVDDEEELEVPDMFLKMMNLEHVE